MGALQQVRTGRMFTLGSRVLIGRGIDAVLRLDDRRVSGEHAAIWFTDGQWWIRDLGSRNGTFVCGRRLAPGEKSALDESAGVSFGGDDWLLCEAGQPIARAVRVADGRRVTAVGGLLALPDPVEPRVTVFAAAGDRWLAEEDGEPRFVTDQAEVAIDGERWLLSLPPRGTDGDMPSTWGPQIVARSLKTLDRLELTISRDEEYVHLALRFHDDLVEMPPRSFQYVLVLLARARADDAAQGVSPGEQGWRYVDEVCNLLSVDPQKLNVEVYRARKQLADAGIEDAADLVERRPQTRQLRLGVAYFKVTGA
ncbi:MAG: FHA domain-containing protein [Myxococcales bacterium]|nr:FHA domain-containing protein [Myxococcales bacterium]